MRADLALAQAQVRALGSELRAAATEANQTGDTTAIRGLAEAYEQARVKVSGLRDALKETGSGGAGGLGEALDGIVASLDKLGGGFGAIGGLLGELTHGFNGVAAAAVAAAAGFFELGKRAAESTIEARNQAAVFGSSVEKFEGLRYAAGQTGISGEVAATAFERFSRGLGQAREAADAAAEKLAAAKPPVDHFADSYRNLTTAVEQAQLALDKSGTSILQANVGVQNAAQKLKDLQDAYRNSNNSQETDARLKLQIRDAEQALTIAQQRAKEAVDAQKIAVEKLAEAERVRAEAAKKHNQELQDQMTKQNASGTAEGAQIGLGARTPTFTGSPGSDTDQALREFADHIKAIQDPAKQTAEVMRMMGRGALAMVPLLKQGGEALREFQEELKALNILPTDEEEKMALGFMKAFEKLKTVVGGLSDAVGNIFGQMFTGGMKEFAQTLADNQKEIREFAQTVVDVVGPALRGAGNAFALLAESLHQIFGLISDVAKYFGKEWPVASVAAVTAVGAVVLAIGKLVSSLGLITGTLGTLKTAFLWVDAAAAPWILLGAGIAAVGAALLLAFGPVKEISQFIHENFGDTLGNAFDAFSKSFDDAILHIGEWMHDKFDALKQYLLDLFESAVQKITDFFQPLIDVIAGITKGINDIISKGAAVKDAVTGGSAGAAAGGSSDNFSGTFATGGIVNGPSGRDRVPIWATAGEAVTRVAAVRHYGADLFHRLNNMQIPRFEMGGFVDAMNPAPQHFAMGGIVAAGGGGSSRSGFTIVLDGQSFDAHSDSRTADSLERTARRRQMTSGGRKPSSYT
jgi:hypothetical protein